MKFFKLLNVIILTLISLFSTGCSSKLLSWLHDNELQCKNRAYIHIPVEEYINERYSSSPLVRVALVPFEVPASFSRNIAGWMNFQEEITQSLHVKLLESGKFQLLEIFKTHPLRKDDFITGNYEITELAKQAGYDLLLVGQVGNLSGVTQLSGTAKLIDVNTGITVWYGQSQVGKVSYSTSRRDAFGVFGRDRPDYMPFRLLADQFTSCLVENIFSEED